MQNSLAIIAAAMATGAFAAPVAAPQASSASCPAPGTTDSQGRYSCNPAHAYPTGQTCELVDGCYLLSTATSTSSTQASATPSCPAPGSTDAQGRYSCNPAHAYPTGQTCSLVDGCYLLSSSTTSSAQASSTPSCPAPGTTDSEGRYSCNPAHAYPTGQVCSLVDGCYFLSSTPSSSSAQASATAGYGSYGTYNNYPDSYASYGSYKREGDVEA